MPKYHQICLLYVSNVGLCHKPAPLSVSYVNASINLGETAPPWRRGGGGHRGVDCDGGLREGRGRLAVVAVANVGVHRGGGLARARRRHGRRCAALKNEISELSAVKIFINHS